MTEPVFKNPTTGRVTTSIAYLGNGVQGAHVGFRERDPERIGSNLRTINYLGAEGFTYTALTDAVNFARTRTFAINFSSTKVQVSDNGVLIPAIESDAAIGLDRIYIGSAPNWSENDTGLIEQVFLLDEQLSAEELVEITRN